MNKHVHRYRPPASRIRPWCLLAMAWGLFAPHPGAGQVKLPRLIGNGMVLQRDTEVKIWGWASPGESVSVNLEQHHYRTHADSIGRWQVMLPKHATGGPYAMVISGSNTITISDILFGDVWVCSGQSNMELTMERVKDRYASAIASSGNTRIRQFLVPDQYDFKREHADVDDGAWVPASPENVLKFSAVAYFFAREIYERHAVPIGLVNAALGGSPAEAWMSEEAIRKFPEAYAEYKKFQDDALIASLEQQSAERSKQWYAALNASDPGVRGGWRNGDGDDWQSFAVPAYWRSPPMNSNGSKWFKKEVIVPKSMVGKPAKLWLGRIVDLDSVFINGAFVGTTGYQYPPRKYDVQATILKEGKNVITVRVINSSGTGGFVPDKPYFLACGNDTLDLKGYWKYKTGATVPALESAEVIRWKPVGLFNRMIAPLLNYAVKGVIWYQGESNAKAPATYAATFAALIENWRARWQQPGLPFLFVQLANFMESKPEPSESLWAELRQAQAQVARLPHTGMAVAIDVGEWNDIHPLNKADVGHRLALLARQMAYGEKNLVAAGPVATSWRFDGHRVSIAFQNAVGGLVIRNGGKPLPVAASTDGKTFYWADAALKGNTLVVTGKRGTRILAVRYAWADNPEGVRLYNTEGLPAGPFEVNAEK